MPYIAQKYRDFYDSIIDGIDTLEVVPGDLAYIITKLLLRYIEPHESYSTYATAIGVLETVKLELYRRRIALYEQEKCEQNGDLF